MAQEDELDVAAEGGEVKKDNTQPLLFLFLVLNIAILGIIAFLQFRAHQREISQVTIQDLIRTQIKRELGTEEFSSEEDKQKEREISKDFLLPLEGFTANLAQGDGPKRYVRLNIVLKFSRDSRPDEFNAKKPQIRDSIIGILNSKRPDDLLKKEGKKYLKEEIKSSINFFLVDGQVLDVYYVGFQIN